MRHFPGTKDSVALERGKKVLFSLLVGLILGIVLLCAFSFVLDQGVLSQSAIPTFALIVTIVVGLVCGFVSAKLWREKGLLAGAVTGCSMFVFLLLLWLLFGERELSVFLLVRFAALVAASCIGGVLGVNHHKRVMP